MTLTFILGKSNSGKTTACIQKMLALPRSQKIIYIVPEQFTLESEKLLTAQRSSLLNIDVVSFSRLRFHIESQTGKIRREFLDEEAKEMILRRLINGEELEIFTKSADKAGFLDCLERIISEFYHFGITPLMLKTQLEAMDKNNPFTKKLTDIYKIYNAYNTFIGEKYISSDMILDYVADKIRDTDIFENTAVFIDGFNSFTPQEYRVIKEIMAYSKSLAITLCLAAPPEKSATDKLTDPFYETKTAYIKLVKIATELFPTGCKINHIYPKNTANPNRALSFLEENFFKFPVPKFEGEQNSIKLITAVNKNAETAAIAEEIRKEAEKGTRYRQMAVILCDPAYAPLLKAELKKRNIPDFADLSTPIINHPLTLFITSLLKTLCYGFNNRDIFTFLKTDLTGISSKQISRLENYSKQYGIEGYRWLFPFKDEYFEKIRINLMEMLSPLNDNFNRKDKYLLSSISKALFETIEKSGFYGKYKKLMESSENSVLTSRHKQIWEQVVSTFNKAEEFLGDSQVTLEEYTKIITAGFCKKKVATIPLYQDNLIIGDIERSRLPHIKKMFVLGAARGSLPQKIEDYGIINDEERLIMKQHGMEIAADTEEKTSLAYLKIYQILTKPAESLVLSCPLGTNSGAAADPSEIWDKIKTMFNITPIFAEEKIYAPQNTTPFVPEEHISQRLMELINGTSLTLSSTRLQTYAECPFSYCLKYILRLRENPEFGISHIDKGNIIHSVMESFFKQAPDLESLTKEEINKRVAELMPDILAKNLSAILSDGNTFPENCSKIKYFCKRIEKTANASIYAGVKQLNLGSFVPAEFEVSFGSGQNDKFHAIELNENTALEGKIDRVDLYEENDNLYVKITDYKSSEQTLDIEEIYSGVKLQLLLYLSAYTEQKQKQVKAKTIRPGALMYFTANNPNLNEKDIAKTTAEKMRLSNYAPTGIAANTPAVTQALDTALSEDFAYIKTKSFRFISEEELGSLMETAKATANSLAEGIRQGSFPVKPYSYKTKSSCAYCPYKGICKISIKEYP